MPIDEHDDLMRRLEGLTPDQRQQLLAQLDEGKAAELPQRKDRTDATIALDEWPLTLEQERLWVLHELAPDSVAYHRMFGIRLRGPLDPQRLELALGCVLERHHILRSTISIEGDRPVQRVTESSSVAIEDLGTTTSDEDIDRAAAKLASRRFDLRADRPFRVGLVRQSDEISTLLICTHHIVSDGWSDGVMLREVAAAYERLGHSDGDTPPDLEMSFAEHAHMVRANPPTSSEAAKRFWSNQLQPQFDPVRLRDWRQHNDDETGNLVVRAVPAELVTMVERLAAEHRVTDFSVWLAATAEVLASESGREDIVFGVPLAGRSSPSAESLIGYFVRTVPIRVRTAKSGSGRALIEQVHHTLLDAIEHQRVTAEDLAAAAGSARGAGVARSINVGFAYQNIPTETVTVGTLTMSPVRCSTGTSKTDLTVYVWPDPDGVLLGLEYRTADVDRVTVDSLADEILGAIQALCRDPAASQSTVGVTALDQMFDRSNLTRNQLLIWVDQRLRPDDARYNIPVRFEIDGSVDEARFERAVEAVVADNDALRIVVTADDGAPTQRVSNEHPVRHELIDLSLNPAAAGVCAEMVDSLSRTPIAMDAPMFTSVLVRLAEDRHVWFVLTHHIVSDGASIRLLFLGVQDRYLQPETTSAAPRFMDAVERERTQSRSRRASEDREFWSRKLAHRRQSSGALGVANGSSANATRVRFELGSSRTQAVRRLAEEATGSLMGPDVAVLNFMSVSVAVWLWRTGRIEDVSIGTPFHYRRSSAARSTIGLFMRMFPLILSPRANTTCRSLLEQGVEELRSVARHRHHVIGDDARGRSFDLLLNYQTIAEATFLGCPVSTEWCHPGAADEDLILQVNDFGATGGLGLQLDVREGVRDGADPASMLRHLVAVIDELSAAPLSALADLPLLPEPDRQVIEAANTTASEPAFRAVHDQVIEFARSDPGQIALVFGEETVTYGEVDRWTDALAAELAARGAIAGECVVVCAPRGIEAVIGALACLRSGAAYVPVDAEFGRGRLDAIVSIASPVAIVTTPRWTETLASFGPATVDMRSIVISNPQRGFERRPARADDIAYAAFTSGSTGEPKGAAVTHGNLFNTQMGWRREYGPGSRADRHLQLASPSFDVFTGEWVRALTSGSTLVIADVPTVVDPTALLALLTLERITHVEFVPSVLRPLLNRADEEATKLEHLRVLAVGSEAWTWHDHLRVAALCPRTTRIVNTYGLTETSIDSSLADMDADRVDDTSGQVPIGLPLAGQQIHVVDDWLHEVPLGSTGELYIGGSSVARGYVKRPSLTAAAFVPNPHSTRPGQRLYRTGDLGRRLPDGSIRYEGRSDRQVKIHGVRIEAAEIETRLRTHPRVHDAAVVAIDDGGEGPRLTANVVCSGSVTATELRSHLSRSLTQHMIPSSFHSVTSIPRTASGKVDSAALQDDRSRVVLRELRYSGPSTTLQRELVDLWSRLLGRDRIGVNDNFFESGGHSLLLVEAQAGLSRLIGREVPIATLFEYVTIASLAQHLDSEQSGPPPIDPKQDGRDEASSSAARRRRLASQQRRRSRS